jgi:hypothetical protein
MFLGGQGKCKYPKSEETRALENEVLLEDL